MRNNKSRVIDGTRWPFSLGFLQVYPTATRALGLGTSSGMARVGALITPFVAQVTPK